MEPINVNNISWSRKRQILIVIGIVIFLTIIFSIAGYAVFYKAPTCSDGKQNQNETGVDCGGACTRICAADTETLSIDWVRLFKIREGVYSAVARIENPAINSIAKDVPYTFMLKNANGETVAQRSGKVFVPSRGTFVIFEGTIITEGSPETVAFTFDASPEWIRSDYVQPELIIVNKELEGVDGAPRLVAEVRNPNVVDVKEVILSALIYDDQGVAVQASQTFIENVPAGETVNATFTWPYPISLRSRVCESPVDTALVIDRSGSMEFLGTNPPQPLTDVKDAARSFVSELSKFDQASVVSFANEGSTPIDAALTPDLSSVEQAISRIAITPPGNTQNTNIGDGMLKALEELNSERHRSGSGKIMVVLTDGVATRPLKTGDITYPEKFAQAVATNAKAAGVRVFTIGLGKDLNQQFLKNIASTSTDFYLAPTTDQLESIYREIGTKMCKRQPTALEIVPSVPLQ